MFKTRVGFKQRAHSSFQAVFLRVPYSRHDLDLLGIGLDHTVRKAATTGQFTLPSAGKED